MVKVKAIRDLPELKLVGRSLGPLTAGQTAELEPWEASVLEKLGYVEPAQQLTLTEIRKLMLAEEKSSELGALPSDFYEAISQKLKRLREEGKPDEARELKAALEALLELRIPKLLERALDPKAVKNVTPEELFLVHQLASSLKDWEHWINRLASFGGDDEAGIRGGDRLTPPDPLER